MKISQVVRTYPFVGICEDGKREPFRSATTPTRRSHAQYVACIGPFITMRGARFMATNGKGNPHCQTVGDAEKLAQWRDA